MTNRLEVGIVMGTTVHEKPADIVVLKDATQQIHSIIIEVQTITASDMKTSQIGRDTRRHRYALTPEINFGKHILDPAATSAELLPSSPEAA
jgi:hypothetical protein